MPSSGSNQTQSRGRVMRGARKDRSCDGGDTFETRRDCLDAVANAVNNPPYNAWYSEPVGCGYHGNSYWRVWLMNLVHGDKDFLCIWRSVDGEKDNVGYGPLLKGYPTRGTDTGHCM